MHPLLKRPSLDPVNLDNYCPVSNSPLLGNIVDRQREDHFFTLKGIDYLDSFQSRSGHGYRTEIALIALLSDLCQDQDKGSASFLNFSSCTTCEGWRWEMLFYSGSSPSLMGHFNQGWWDIRSQSVLFDMWAAVGVSCLSPAFWHLYETIGEDHLTVWSGIISGNSIWYHHYDLLGKCCHCPIPVFEGFKVLDEIEQAEIELK